MKRLLFFLVAWLPSGLSAQPVPLRLHPQNPHYFEFRGKPTVLITSGEHYGAVLNPDFDYKTYLATLAEQGLNYTRVFSGSYSEAPGLGDFGIPANTLAPKPGRLLAPFARTEALGRYPNPGYYRGGAKFDLDRWDDTYFARLTDFVAEAGKRGIVVELTLFTAHYSEDGWLSSPFHPFNHANAADSVARLDAQTLRNGNLTAYQEKLTRKLVRALNAFDNVFFEIQNEPWAEAGVVVARGVVQTDPVQPGAESWHRVVEVARPASLAWQRRIASAIREEEKTLPNQHLIAQNVSNFYHKIEDPDPLVSIFHVHYAFPEAASQNQGLNRAIGLDETGFNGSADSTYRRQAWRFLLAGGALFNNLDYSFTPDDPRGTFFDPRSPGGGSAALRREFGVLKTFLESLDFLAMQPAADWLQHLPTGTRAYALAAPGKQYAVYFEGPATATADGVLPRGTYREAWIDVRTGQTIKLLTRQHMGGSYALRGPVGRGEVALRLVKD